jgi:diguanylate cyclase (GGDEF)-like protein
MNAVVTTEVIDRAWPVLSALPFPAMQIGADYRVVAANRVALERYGPVGQMCYEISHGYAVPCDQHGESCPKLVAERANEPVAVMHVHHVVKGIERYKIAALPIEGGGILELHIPLDDVTTTDVLTGLTNRSEGEQLVRRSIALIARMRLGYSLVMLDLDHFKRINDSFGHQAGDLVLAAFAGVLLGTVREADLAIRWGGEEFLVLLPGEDMAAAERFAGRVLEETRKLSVAVGSTMLRVTVSVGIRHVAPDEVESVRFDQAVKDADDALYHTKRSGRDRHHVHRSSSPERR